MGTWGWPTGAGTAGASDHLLRDGRTPSAGDCNKLVTLDLEPKKLTRQVISGMEEHDLLNYASAIAFQVMTAMIPMALLVLSVMSILQLQSVWTAHLAPQVKAQVSPQVFAVLDDVGRKTLGSKQGW